MRLFVASYSMIELPLLGTKHQVVCFPQELRLQMQQLQFPLT